jgi:large subunit ribosomal protein L28
MHPGMARICEFCGKRPRRGQHIARRGLAKAKGGVGRKITGRAMRTFRPNIQILRAIVDGKVKRVHICVGCLKLGKVLRAVR